MSAPVPVVRTITQERVHAYADASGDHNPIHIDESYAATTPFGGTIAHGMLVLATLAEMMHESYGDAWLRDGRMKVRFKAPARPGVTVTARADAAKDGSRQHAVHCLGDSGSALIEGRAGVDAE